MAGLHVLVLIGAISVAYLGAPRDAPAKGRVCPFLQGVACSLGSARQCPASLPARGGRSESGRPCNPPPVPGPAFLLPTRCTWYAPAPWARNTRRHPSPCHSPGLFAGLTCVCPCQPKRSPHGPDMGHWALGRSSGALPALQTKERAAPPACGNCPVCRC